MLIPLGKHGQETARLSQLLAGTWEGVSMESDGLALRVKGQIKGDTILIPKIPLKTYSHAIITWNPEIKVSTIFMDSQSSFALKGRVPKGTNPEELSYHIRVSLGLYKTGR